MENHSLDALPAGQVIDGYRIERELGSGGFGITYLAVEIESGRKVAIKEYMPKAFARRTPGDWSVRPVDTQARAHFDWGLERFRDEARALIRLHHPNIVLTLRLFSAHGTAYIVMNYVEGESLASVLMRSGTLTEAEIMRLVPPLLDGLESVHATGFLHRDLKPANIYIRRSDGQPVLLDFGAAREALSRETQTLSAIVTPRYSPPEQYGSGARQKETADIYALGATLYRCVTGQAPPDAPDRVSALVANRPDPLRKAAEAGRGQYSPSLLAAIDAGLRVREDERPQTIAALRAVLAGAPAEAAPPHAIEARADTLMTGPPRAAHADAGTLFTGEPPRAAKARSPRWRVAFAVLALAAAGGAGYYGYTEWQAAREAERIFVQREREMAEAKRASEETARRKREEEAESARRESALKPGAVFRDCPACPEMIVIAPGSFQMGSPPEEDGRYSYEGPQHQVAVTKPFALGKFKITRGEWAIFVSDSGHRPVDGCIHFTGKQWLRDIGRNWEKPGFAQGEDHPVVCISWQDAHVYVAWLSKKTGKKYRLASEAEWEYAARAGTTTARPWSDTDTCKIANGADAATRRAGLLYAITAECDDGFPYTAPAGRFSPNANGLYDVIGNAWEWTEDCWIADYGSAPADARPVGEGGNCALRAVRGGGWTSGPTDLRSAVRVSGERRFGYNYVGLRVAREVE